MNGLLSGVLLPQQQQPSAQSGDPMALLRALGLMQLQSQMTADQNANVQGYKYYPPTQTRQMGEAQGISDSLGGHGGYAPYKWLQQNLPNMLGLYQLLNR